MEKKNNILPIIIKFKYSYRIIFRRRHKQFFTRKGKKKTIPIHWTFKDIKIIPVCKIFVFGLWVEVQYFCFRSAITCVMVLFLNCYYMCNGLVFGLQAHVRWFFFFLDCNCMCDCFVFRLLLHFNGFVFGQLLHVRWFCF